MTDTSTQTTEWPDSLIVLLERQHELMDELSTLATQQAALVEQRETDALLGLLSHRQRLIEEFTGSQSFLTDLTDDLEARITAATEGQRSRIRTLIGDIGDRLADVMARDAEDQATLQAARDQARGALATVDTAQQARNAYRVMPVAESRFADRKG